MPVSRPGPGQKIVQPTNRNIKKVNEKAEVGRKSKSGPRPGNRPTNPPEIKEMKIRKYKRPRPDCFHLHWSQLFPGSKYPKNIPARFARRIASFYYFPLLLSPKYPISPARFVRRIVSFYYSVAASGHKILQIFPARFARRPASQAVGLRLQ